MKALGFDYGTSFSTLAFSQESEITASSFEVLRTLSLVYIAPGTNSKIVGHSAKNYLLSTPGQVLFNTKPNLGRPEFKTINGLNYTATDAIREILAFLRLKAEDKLDRNANSIVASLPFCLGENGRRELAKAVGATGLALLDAIPDAFAASIAFAKNQTEKKRILAVGIGSATYDIAFVETAPESAECKASTGGRIGGRIFDLDIARFLYKQLPEKSETDFSAEPDDFQNALLQLAEKVKKDLSDKQSVEVSAEIQGLKLEITDFDRARMAALIQPRLQEIETKINHLLRSEGQYIETLDELLLFGGSCQHPILQDWIERKFKRPVFDTDPETSVARGAAIHCCRLMSGLAKVINPPNTFEKRIPRSIGIEMFMEKLSRTQLVHILKRNTRFPARGVIFGSTQAGQSRIVLKIFQGEDIDTVPRNQFLGHLMFDIQPQNSNMSNGLALVFHLDDLHKLTFTVVEIPYSKDILEDLDFQRLVEFSDRNESVIPFADLDILMRRYDFNQKEYSFILPTL